MSTKVDIQELMRGWDAIVAAAKVQFPDLTEEELYQIAKSAMAYALTK